MTTNPVDEERPAPFNPTAENRPQYVHEVALDTPPQITPSIPPCKDTRQRCIKHTEAAVISALLLLLVAGVLLGYYLSSWCYGVRCDDGQCIGRSQWCDGVKDCPSGQDEAMCFRLYGSSFLLQAYRLEDRSWRPVCSDGWTSDHGRAACQSIGYSRATYVRSDQLKTNASDGYFLLKAGSSPDTPILQQLVNSNTCSTGTGVTLRCIDCGTKVPFESTRIVGGRPASPGAWPWQVRLSSEVVCGGSIITPYWIVTAARCVQRHPSPESWSIHAGVVKVSSIILTPTLKVSYIVAHEGYQPETTRNDIALMRLTEPLVMTAEVGPVCLPNIGMDFKTDRTCWISGFGSTEPGRPSATDLMEAEVVLINSTVCNSAAAYNGRITQDMICAGSLEGGVDTCQGDSGGPLVTEMDSVWWLVGDTSWGHVCTEKNKPGVYGNITFFLGWIYEQMQKFQDAEDSV